MYRASSIQVLTIANENLTLNSPVLPINNEQLELPSLYIFPLLQNSSNLINLVEQNSVIDLPLYYDSSQFGLPPSYTFPLLQNLINPVEQNFDSIINIPEPSSLLIAMPVSGISDSVINIPEFSSLSIATPVPGISDSVIAMP
ncbi:42145_t:CDS:2, partial [Gigaspora margarita]